MHSFLPIKPPLRYFNTKKKSLSNISEVASELPKLLLTSKVQSRINSLAKNSFSVDYLIKNKKSREINLAMAQLSFIGHAYIWGGNKPQNVLPEVVSLSLIHI